MYIPIAKGGTMLEVLRGQGKEVIVRLMNEKAEMEEFWRGTDCEVLTKMMKERGIKIYQLSATALAMCFFEK